MEPDNFLLLNCHLQASTDIYKYKIQNEKTRIFCLFSFKSLYEDKIITPRPAENGDNLPVKLSEAKITTREVK